LIDVGVSLAVANATTQAFFGTNAWSFFTDGWFGRASPGSGNSWKLSLNELVMGAIDPSTRSGMSASYASTAGISGAIQKNLKDHGMTSLATVLLAPAAGKLIKRLARKPINDLNRLVVKPLGIGVKI
jgi:hypothetical protein